MIEDFLAAAQTGTSLERRLIIMPPARLPSMPPTSPPSPPPIHPHQAPALDARVRPPVVMVVVFAHTARALEVPWRVSRCPAGRCTRVCQTPTGSVGCRQPGLAPRRATSFAVKASTFRASGCWLMVKATSHILMVVINRGVWRFGVLLSAVRVCRLSGSGTLVVAATHRTGQSRRARFHRHSSIYNNNKRGGGTFPVSRHTSVTLTGQAPRILVDPAHTVQACNDLDQNVRELAARRPRGRL